MAHDNSHSIRSGVIATVIGGIILSGLAYLWPPLRSAATWCWHKLVQFFALFTNTYSIPGWVLLLLAVIALPTIVQILVGLRKREEPPYAAYTEDIIHGAKWRWHWYGGEISNLWCYCPRCDSELVYDHGYNHGKTNFICEHCEHSVIASIVGGDKDYALSAVQREIRRKIRTNQVPLKQQT